MPRGRPRKWPRRLPRASPWRILLGPDGPPDPAAVDALVELWATMAKEGDVRAIRAIDRAVPDAIWPKLAGAIRDGWGLPADADIGRAVWDRVIATATGGGGGRPDDMIGCARIVAGVGRRRLDELAEPGGP